MARKIYEARNAKASGPYSQAVDSGEYVYLSGQTAMNGLTSEDLTGDITTQTNRCFQYLFEVLEAADLTPEDVVKVNVYLTDMKTFHAMNEVYESRFHKPYPARTCIAVLALPLGAEVEIEMIAKRSS